MVTSIARQSVIIKCNLATSIMTGNYEFYYATGLLYKLTGHEAGELSEPAALHARVLEVLDTYAPADDREKHLAKMLRFYKPTELFDEQMKELFQTGYNERYLWQEKLPAAE